MRVIRVRALRECIAPNSTSVHLGCSVSCSYARSSEAEGDAPRAAQPVWCALRRTTTHDFDRWRRNHAPQQRKRRADIAANAPLVAAVRRSARANTKAQQDRARNGERLSQRKCMHVRDVAVAVGTWVDQEVQPRA